VNVVVQVTLKRDPMFPDVPAAAEFAKDQKTKDVLKLVLAPQEMDRPILAPPGVPADRVAALRKAFHETMTDPAFLAEAKKEHLEVAEVSGEDVAEIVQSAFALPRDVVDEATEAMHVTGSSPKSSKSPKSN
jgi:tripartite-type tricarboxylate transporter receptor subunit TctC